MTGKIRIEKKLPVLFLLSPKLCITVLEYVSINLERGHMNTDEVYHRFADNIVFIFENLEEAAGRIEGLQNVKSHTVYKYYVKKIKSMTNLGSSRNITITEARQTGFRTTNI